MPTSVEEFLKWADEPEPPRVSRNGSATTGGGGGKWRPIFEEHTEGGGPFLGRNNALTALVGFLRAKSFPYEAALSYAGSWNERYCVPPMNAQEVDDRVGRAWHEWIEGGHEDAKPEDVKPGTPERLILTADELLDKDESGGGMEWLVPNVFVKQGIHFVSAPAAGAKSWLMLELSKCVATGTAWMGIEDIPQGPVLYIDEEMGSSTTSTRVRKLDFGRGLPFYYVGKQGLRMTDAEDRAFILKTCREKGITLLCIDTLTGIMPGLRENEAEHVSRLRGHFNEFTGTGATLLVAHHDRKGGQGDSSVAHERMAGSRDFGAMADMSYGIDKRGSVFHLSITKNRYLSDDEALSIDFVLEDNHDHSKVTLRVLSTDERVELNAQKAKQSVEERILDALAAGPLSTTEVITAVEGSANLTTAVVKSMADRGVLTSERSGRSIIYSLASIE